ncbi:hypothetical protein FPOAC1_005821 [Fusarium poae]|uniref:hypothetical protein n=1 Tax=Fusarium poae TaxID=36050 RepID=UPI001CEAFE1E|nr:hypothetical protein FPOAC1_005821 [Fusarium poae]KAG8672545.1 hypothetical protein FPOAC1_005821 [Fusarium poae]
MDSPNVIEGWHKLPYEIQLEILEFALTPPIKLPAPSEVQSGDCARVWFRLWNRRPKNLARDLLLVNKRFHDDTQRIIKFMLEVYHLDVMVVKDYGLWTTWYLPKLPKFTHVDEVTVTFRIFGSAGDLQSYFKNTLDYADKITHAMRDLHNLFAHLIGIGPGFFSKRNRGNFFIY